MHPEGSGRWDHPSRPLASSAPRPSQAQGNPSHALGTHPQPPGPPDNGTDPERHRHPPTRQPQVPPDDGSGLLRRIAPIRGGHAPAEGAELPGKGWGRIHVTEADIDFDEPGEPKTGQRAVPIPPVLVNLLRSWIDKNEFLDDDLLFRTRTGARPSGSNWSRTLHLAQEKCGCPQLRVYDCRHAAATTWLRAGVPLGEVAKRMGHSVETLVSTYVGALEGDEQLSNERIEAALAGSVELPKRRAARNRRPRTSTDTAA